MRPAIEALLAGATIDGVARDDMIAGLQVPYILPDLLDDARRLMPHHGRNGEMGHCTLFEMQIAVTHAARRGPDKNLIIGGLVDRSEEHTSELQSLMRISYAVLCLKKHTNCI